MVAESHETKEIPYIESFPREISEVVKGVVETGPDKIGLEIEEKSRQQELPQVLDAAQKLAEPTLISAKSEEEKYLDKNLPDHLQQKSLSGKVINKTVSLFFRFREKFRSFRVEGRNNIPTDGPFLILSNHSGGETGKLLALFGDKNVHISAGEELNFKRSKFRSELLKKIGMISIQESLAHLSEDEKMALLARVPKRSRAGYERILAKGVPTYSEIKKFVKSAVAALIKGEPVVVFPEGLFTYEGTGLRKAFGGWELVAREYKNVTGKDLPILPVGVTKNSISIGSITEVQDTDSVMKKIAALLPDDMCGVYKE